MIEGGCFCGAVRYAIEPAEYLSVNCHCSMCRRIHAAPFVTWLVVPADNFRYLTQAPKAFRSSPNGVRYHCVVCGGQIACINDAHPDIIDVAVGSLDRPGAFPPTRDVFCDGRLSWT